MTEALGLEEALDIAMDAELKAQAFYAQAAIEVQDPQGRDLLGRLAAFEQYHYEKLAELARSLQEEWQVHRVRNADHGAVCARGRAAARRRARS